jgi:hypothetical protein
VRPWPQSPLAPDDRGGLVVDLHTRRRLVTPVAVCSTACGSRYSWAEWQRLRPAGTEARGGEIYELRLCRHGCLTSLARYLGRAPWWRRVLAYFCIGGTP